jgi:NADH dehydrogenase
MDRPETFSKAIGASDKAGVGGGPCKLSLANRPGDNLRKRGHAAITLIDKRDTFRAWKPKLHEIATGGMDIGAH